MKAVDLKQAREFVEKQIREWRDGWTNQIQPDKGKITDKGALKAIATLKFILKTLPKPPLSRYDEQARKLEKRLKLDRKQRKDAHEINETRNK